MANKQQAITVYLCPENQSCIEKNIDIHMAKKGESEMAWYGCRSSCKDKGRGIEEPPEWFTEEEKQCFMRGCGNEVLLVKHVERAENIMLLLGIGHLPKICALSAVTLKVIKQAINGDTTVEDNPDKTMPPSGSAHYYDGGGMHFWVSVPKSNDDRRQRQDKDRNELEAELYRRIGQLKAELEWL